MELIPEETRKNMGVAMGGFGFMAWTLLGALLVITTCVKPMNHATFWPLIIFILCALGYQSLGKIQIKLALSGLALLLAGWIVLNSLNGWAVPAAPSMAEMMAAITAGDMSVLGGALGPMLGGLAAGGGVILMFASFMGLSAAVVRIRKG